MALLRDTEVSSIDLVLIDSIAKAFDVFADSLFVALQAGEILIPANVIGSGELGEFHLQADVFYVVGKSRAKKTSHILEKKGSGLSLCNSADRLREHVTRVFHSSGFSTHGERLAGRTSRHKIDALEAFEIDIPHVRAVNFATLQGMIPDLLIVNERFNGSRIPLVERQMLESRLVKPKRESAST